MTTSVAKAHGKWVGVCGGAAGDKDVVKILVGLDEVLHQYTLPELQKIAQKALTLSSSKAIRDFLKQNN